MDPRESIHNLLDNVPEHELPVVRRAIELIVRNARKHREAGQSALVQAGDLVGCLNGGPSDLSFNPSYLADFSK